MYRNAVPATQNQQQKLRVCEICAAFLSLYDNDRRLADHFGGRLHMGFISVRDRLEELEVSLFFRFFWMMSFFYPIKSILNRCKFIGF